MSDDRRRDAKIFADALRLALASERLAIEYARAAWELRDAAVDATTIAASAAERFARYVQPYDEMRLAEPRIWEALAERDEART